MRPFSWALCPVYNECKILNEADDNHVAATDDDCSTKKPMMNESAAALDFGRIRVSHYKTLSLLWLIGIQFKVGFEVL